MVGGVNGICMATKHIKWKKIYERFYINLIGINKVLFLQRKEEERLKTH